jgi:hypothetical protein
MKAEESLQIRDGLREDPWSEKGKRGSEDMVFI